MGARTQEQSALWLPASLPGYELFKARFRTHRYARHIHDRFGVCIVEEGAHRFTTEGSVNVAPSRNVFIINPGDVHDGRAFGEQGYTFRVFFVGGAAMAQAAADEPDDFAEPRFLHPVIGEPQLADELIALHRACEPGGTVDPLAAQSRLSLVLGTMAIRHGSLRPPRVMRRVETARMERVRGWMLDHLDQTIDLDAAAAQAGLSPFHFLRQFKSATGLPPHAWLIQARVARARDLLRRGRSPAEVAVAVGFFDQPHFSRHFLAVTGLTPGQYRAAFAAGRGSKNVQDATGCRD